MTRLLAIISVLLLLIVFPLSAQDTPTPETVEYTVHSGDTLGQIAARYHTTVGAIMRLNDLPSAELIVIGQTLRIPADVPAEATPAPAETILPPGSGEPSLPAFDYGIEAFFNDPNIGGTVQQIAALGMHWAKLRISWAALEAQPGSIDYTRLDTIIDALQAQSLKSLLTITDAPAWVRSSAVENGPPDNFADYSAFVAALATHYAGRVQAYEIWNEPNLRREWNSPVHPLGADGYIDLLRGAYAAVKSADPNALVVSAGLAPTGFNDAVNALDDRQYLARMVALGVAGISDAVGAHPFGYANPPDATCCAAPEGVLTHYGQPSFYFQDTLNDYHQILLANGDVNTPLWVTQFGWGSSEDTAAPPRNSLYFRYTSLEQQAKDVTRGFEIGAETSFVGVMILYNLDACIGQPVDQEACYYSITAPDGQPRLVYQALSMIFAAAVSH